MIEYCLYDPVSQGQHKEGVFIMSDFLNNIKLIFKLHYYEIMHGGWEIKKLSKIVQRNLWMASYLTSRCLLAILYIFSLPDWTSTFQRWFSLLQDH